MAGIVVVFDFDKTIVDCDTDNWMVDDLGATDHFDSLLLTLPWNTAMDQMMMELHSQGKTMEDVAESLKKAPLYPNIISAIKSAHNLGCELRILSDANIFFIETILKHHGLMSYFSEITANPAYVDEERKLRISPYHNFTTSPHGCGIGICPPNMCKGAIIERIIRRTRGLADQGKKRFIYLGDGRGDYCPSLKLSEEDYVMPRKKYPLWELICNDPKALKADHVHEWSNAEELETLLLRIINKETSTSTSSVECGGEVGKLLPMDCKFQSTIPAAAMSAHEAPLPHALPVPQ